MNDRLTELAGSLRTHSPGMIWGVSPASVYLGCCGIATDTPIAEALEPHHRRTILRTNDERSRGQVAELHHELLTSWGLVTTDRKLTDTGRILVRSDSPLPLVSLVATKRSPRIDRFVKELERIDPDSMPRGEVQGICQDSFDENVVVPLLGSLGFGDLHPEGMIIDQERVRTVRSLPSDERPVETLRTILLVRQLTEDATPGTVATVCREYLDASITADTVRDLEEAPALASLAEDDPTRTPLGELRDAIDGVISSWKHRHEQLRKFVTTTPKESGLVVTGTELTPDELTSSLTDFDQEGVELVRNLLYSLSEGTITSPVAVQYLTERIDVSGYDLYSALQSLPDVECKMGGDNDLNFVRIPSITEGHDLSEDYLGTMIDLLQGRKSEILDLQSLSLVETPRTREKVVSSIFADLESGVVSPTLFAFTLPDPDALGEERMNKYVDDVPELKQERAKLKRWKKQRRPDTKRYKELTDRLFSRGLERDLNEQVLRIMTPFDDDTFSEYAAQVRSLLRNGYEVQFLTRHTRSQYEWERLRDNLLGELDENRDNVTIRTYSRYKEYRRITGDPDQVPGEFGIHAKLQTIGNAEEGVALVGSANFMENSYNWNPECGAYTENDNFVQAAIDFFDHVWDLSAPDEVSLERLQEIPRKMRYPSYYT